MNYFILFGNCTLVKGAQLCLICDLQRNEFTHIPLELFNIIEDLKSKSIVDALKLFNDEDKISIMEYLEWIVKNDWGMLSNNEEDLKRFIPVNIDWNIPFSISNIILYFNDNSINYLEKITREINILNIPHAEIFIKNGLKTEEIIKKLNSMAFRSIQLNFISPIPNFEIKDYEELCKANYRISSIIVFNSSAEFTKHLIFSDMVNLIFTPQIFNSKSCGIVSREYFNSNLKNYSESLKSNSCLNRKISVDFEGEIRNCPSMLESFGNVNDTSLDEALNKNGFKKYWDINKDKVKVCQDCEFRYVCTDCRAFIEDPNDIYSKPLKCGYNPYTATWEEWSTNPLKQKAIQFYGMDELIKVIQ